MFAVLGDIEFELITYWDGFEATFGVDYVEHARIEGKPGLQFVGDKLDEIQISLVFHQHYCVPDVELARLRTAMKAHQALALVFGNGDYRGWFVITDVTATSEQTDSTGNVLAVNATASLREYIGDPKNRLPEKQKVLMSMEELIHHFIVATQGIEAPPGEVYFGAENPKGELGFYICSKGGGVPHRLKIRSPSFCNLSILPKLLPGHMVSDVVAILGSLDFVMGECDR